MSTLNWSLTHLDAEDRPKTSSVDQNHHHGQHHEQNRYYGSKHILMSLLNILLVVLVFIPDLLLSAYGDPFKQGFFCSDETISHPYSDSTVTSHMLYATGVFLPVAMILSVEISLACCKSRDSPTIGCIVIGKYVIKVPAHILSACQAMLGYSLGAGATKSITHIIKYSAGRLRPHFFAVCRPDWQNINCSSSEIDPTPVYVTNYTCRGNYELFETEDEVQDRIRQSRLSFPSGHASFAAQAMTFLIIYLQARIMTSKRRKYASGSFAVPFLQFCLATFAFYTSVSRVCDYKHHVGDVIVGSILGIAVQAFVTVTVLDLFDRRQSRSPDQKLNLDNNGFHMNSLNGDADNDRRRHTKSLPH